MNDSSRPRQHKGRGAGSNRSGRFEAHQHEAFDDGWGSLDEEAPPLDTEISREHTVRILTRNDSPDVPFDRSINPYKGCEHGCIYCFARPSHAYLGYSPGLDFESKIVSKPDAARALERELSVRGYRCQPIALGANTDPYQPIERKLAITRSVLEVLERCRHPVSIVTKSAAVTRDLDILAGMAEANLASVFVSLTTLDRTLARRMEPRAAAPHRRLDTIARLSEAGVPVGVLVSPVVPGLTDHEIEALVEAVAGAGARSAGTILLRLPRETADLFHEWLERHYPDRASRVISLIRQTRGGELYRSEFGERMRGTGPVAEIIRRRFDAACARHGLSGPMAPLDCSQFRPPPRGNQLNLFQ